jgi:L-aspartate oxidase
MIVVMALRREESRGAHCRIDFPQRARDARRATLNLADAIATAREIDRHFSPTARRA